MINDSISAEPQIIEYNRFFVAHHFADLKYDKICGSALKYNRLEH